MALIVTSAQAGLDEEAMNEASPLLRVDAVSHHYITRGGRLPVLADVSFTLPRGRFTAIVGPSGSGKSTLLNLIAGLEEPSAGAILVNGSSHRLGTVGYMPQRDLLHPWRDALDNATVGLEVRGVARSEARERAQELFARFGLRGFEHNRPHTLSGGMRQRVALARTVLASRELMLLDEPFGALDALTRAAMHDWLLATWPALKLSGLLITHDVEEALLLGDEVLVLSPRPGRIIERIRPPFAAPRRRAILRDPRFAALKLALLGLLGLDTRDEVAE